jgi:hypothetical protein
MMMKYLTHYYFDVRHPFRSISTLPDDEALSVMKPLASDDLFGIRFKNPEQYLKDRKDTETWLRSSFIAKGKKPADSHPLYLIVGDSEWIEEKNIFKMKISVPVDILSDNDVSFTFPDSMFSLMFSKDKTKEYIEHLHGIVFTLSEMNELLNGILKPGDNFSERNKARNEYIISPYIEAQVWNRKLIFDYLEDNANPISLMHDVKAD